MQPTATQHLTSVSLFVEIGSQSLTRVEPSSASSATEAQARQYVTLG